MNSNINLKNKNNKKLLNNFNNKKNEYKTFIEKNMNINGARKKIVMLLIIIKIKYNIIKMEMVKFIN